MDKCYICGDGSEWTLYVEDRYDPVGIAVCNNHRNDITGLQWVKKDK